jgi:hypothetical protein
MNHEESTAIVREIMQRASGVKEIEPGVWQYSCVDFVFDLVFVDDDFDLDEQVTGKNISRALEYLELAYNAEGRAQGIEEAKQLLSTLK